MTPAAVKSIDAIRRAREQHRAGAGSVLDILLRSSGSTPDELAQLLDEHGGVAMIAPGSGRAPDFAILDSDNARRLRCVPLMNEGEELLVACEDPWDSVLMLRVGTILKTGFLPAAASQADLARWLGPPPARGTSAEISTSSEGPVVEFVHAALSAGYRAGASDVHFETDKIGLTVKHRLDGVMQVHARLDDPVVAAEVVSRIKVLAQLDITERRVPQDGRFRYVLGGSDVDLRVSIMPNVHGEDAVLRLLDKARVASLGDKIDLPGLGFRQAAVTAIRALASAPSGMLLVTGPTGSGKTTTVYAALTEINTGIEKIVTIEDPVEYDLPGVLQIPVNERKGLTFAKGLRSILRHDPDRILVGEIRDAETAEIAVQSALTGHLVFTTVHANSLYDVVGRFRHFGLDMFGLTSALNGVVVQRLIRRLCPQCRSHRNSMPTEREWLSACGHAADEVPTAVGCITCHGTGYRGRFVLAEVHRVDDVMRDLVTSGAPLSALKAHVAAAGAEALEQQAARCVVERDTTLEEVRRVVGLEA